MGRQQVPILKRTVQAAGVIAAKRFVTHARAQGTTNDQTIGVADFAAAAAGDECAVTILGTAVVEFGGVVNPGGAVKCGANGKAVAHDSTNPKVGYLAPWESATADGTFAEVVLIPNV